MRPDDACCGSPERDVSYPALPRLRASAVAVAEDFGRHILACGGELKNTFCVAKDRHVFPSHHIGDLENYETLIPSGKESSISAGSSMYSRSWLPRPPPRIPLHQVCP